MSRAKPSWGVASGCLSHGRLVGTVGLHGRRYIYIYMCVCVIIFFKNSMCRCFFKNHSSAGFPHRYVV